MDTNAFGPEPTTDEFGAFDLDFDFFEGADEPVEFEPCGPDCTCAEEALFDALSEALGLDEEQEVSSRDQELDQLFDEHIADVSDILREAFQKGYELGHLDGGDAGFEAGYDEGFDEGYAAGVQDGAREALDTVATIKQDVAEDGDPRYVPVGEFLDTLQALQVLCVAGELLAEEVDALQDTSAWNFAEFAEAHNAVADAVTELGDDLDADAAFLEALAERVTALEDELTRTKSALYLS